MLNPPTIVGPLPAINTFWPPRFKICWGSPRALKLLVVTPTVDTGIAAWELCVVWAVATLDEATITWVVCGVSVVATLDEATATWVLCGVSSRVSGGAEWTSADIVEVVEESPIAEVVGGSPISPVSAVECSTALVVDVVGCWTAFWVKCTPGTTCPVLLNLVESTPKAIILAFNTNCSACNFVRAEEQSDALSMIFWISFWQLESFSFMSSRASVTSLKSCNTWFTIRSRSFFSPSLCAFFTLM